MSWVTGDFGAMRATRDLAARYGAHVTVAVMDLNLADVALSNFDRDDCLTVGDGLRRGEPTLRAGDRARRQPVARRRTRAGGRRRRRWTSAVAMPRSPAIRDDPRMLADLYGRVLCHPRRSSATSSTNSPALLDQMIVHVRRGPTTTSVYPGRAIWALLHTIADDDLGAAARAEYHETTAPIGLAAASTCSATGHRGGRAGPARVARGGRGRRSTRPPTELRRPAGRDRDGARVACCSSPVPRSATAGVTPSPGCGSRRRGSPPAATTGSSAGRERCWVRRGRRCRGAAAATPTCPRRCAPSG